MENGYYELTMDRGFDYGSRYKTLAGAQESARYYVENCDALVKVWHVVGDDRVVMDSMAAHSEEA